MKATEAKLLQILGAVSQFIIPIYQRTYSWTLKECQQLWADILRAGSMDEIGVHFIGSVVHIDEGLGNPVVQAPKLVIDGQQRLTTVTLLLTALADVLDALPEDQQEPIEEFAPAMIRETYLTRRHQKGEKRFKLLLSDTDRVTLMALVDPTAAALPSEPSIRIQENHQFFLEQLRAPTTDLSVVCRGISKLLVVDVGLSRAQDNPQLIFESMNSTGRELSQADLIRNYVLMGQPPELQERLYALHWRPMELPFGQEAYSGNEFSAFMRDFLTLQTGEVPLLDRVYDTFKAYARRPDIEQAGTESLLQEVHAVAGRYSRIVLAKEPDPALHQAFLNLRELKVNVVNPLLLELYGDHEAGQLSHGEFLEALQLLESYVFRRAVCAIPSNSQQKTFATFSRSLRKENGHVLPASRPTCSASLPTAASPATRNSAATSSSAISTSSTRAAATGSVDWRTTSARSRSPWPTTRSSTSFLRTLSCPPPGAMRWATTGRPSRRSGCTASATSPSPATTLSSAIAPFSRSGITKVVLPAAP
jgi:uncharacterized protein with ParB-like and HNH nuclease domain